MIALLVFEIQDLDIFLQYPLYSFYYWFENDSSSEPKRCTRKRMSMTAL